MDATPLIRSAEAAASAQALALSWSAEVTEALVILTTAMKLLGTERPDVRLHLEDAADRLGWCEPEGALLDLLAPQEVH